MGALFGTSIDVATLQALTDDALILRQWISLMLDTDPGAYWSAPTVGASLRAWILRGLTGDALAAIPATVQAALAEDERIQSVSVDATQTFTGGGGVAVRLAITVHPKGASGQPYQFTAIASADRVQVVVGNT